MTATGTSVTVTASAGNLDLAAQGSIKATGKDVALTLTGGLTASAGKAITMGSSDVITLAAIKDATFTGSNVRIASASGDVVVVGSTAAKVSAPAISLTGSTTVTGTFEATAATTLKADLTALGAVYVKDIIDSNPSVPAALSIGATTATALNLGKAGVATNVKGTFDVKEDSVLQAKLQVGGNLDAKGSTLTAGGDADFSLTRPLRSDAGAAYATKIIGQHGKLAAPNAGGSVEITGGTSGASGTTGGHVKINGGADTAGNTPGTVMVGPDSGIVEISKVGKSTMVKGTLAIIGATTTSSTLTVNGAVSVLGAVDTTAAAALTVGAASATAVEIAKTGVPTNVKGSLVVSEAAAIQGASLNVGSNTAFTLQRPQVDGAGTSGAAFNIKGQQGRAAGHNGGDVAIVGGDAATTGDTGGNVHIDGSTNSANAANHGVVNVGVNSGRIFLGKSSGGTKTVVKGLLTVDEAATLSKDVTVGGKLLSTSGIVDTSAAVKLTVGALTATAIEIAKGGIPTAVKGSLVVTQLGTFEDSLVVQGASLNVGSNAAFTMQRPQVDGAGTSGAAFNIKGQQGRAAGHNGGDVAIVGGDAATTGDTGGNVHIDGSTNSANAANHGVVNVGVNSGRIFLGKSSGGTKTVVKGLLTVDEAATLSKDVTVGGKLLSTSGIVDTSAAVKLTVGALTATAIEIAKGGIPTAVKGSLVVTQLGTFEDSLVVSKTLTVQGTLTTVGGDNEFKLKRAAASNDIAPTSFVVEGQSADDNDDSHANLHGGNVVIKAGVKGGHGSTKDGAIEIGATQTDRLLLGSTTAGTTVLGTLDVTLAVSMANALTVGGDVKVKQVFDVVSPGSLDIATGSATAVNVAKAGVPTAVKGSLSVVQATTLASTLVVDGTLTSKGNTATVGGDGDFVLGRPERSSGGAAFKTTMSGQNGKAAGLNAGGPVYITGGDSGNGGTVGGDVIINAGDDSAGATHGTVAIGGTSGTVTIGKTGVSKTTTVKGALNVIEDAVFSAKLDVGGDVTIKQKLDAKGATALDIATATATSVNVAKAGVATNIKGSMAVTQAAVLSSTLQVDGAVTAKAATVTVGGDADFSLLRPARTDAGNAYATIMIGQNGKAAGAHLGGSVEITGGKSGAGGTTGGHVKIDGGADTAGATHGTVKIAGDSGVVEMSKAGTATTIKGTLAVAEAVTLSAALTVGGAVKVQALVDTSAGVSLEFGKTTASDVKIGKAAGATKVLSTLEVDKKVTVLTGGIDVRAGGIIDAGAVAAATLVASGTITAGAKLTVSAGGATINGGLDMSAVGSTIAVVDSNTEALIMKQGTNKFIALDTQNEKVIVSQNTEVGADLSTTAGGKITSAGKLTVSAGGALMNGGLDLAAGGVTNAGAVAGVTTLATSSTAAVGGKLTVAAGGAEINGGLDNTVGGMTNVGAVTGVTTLAASSTITSGGKVTVTAGGFEVAAGGAKISGGLTVESVGIDNKGFGITNAGAIAGATTIASTGEATIGGATTVKGELVAEKQVVFKKMSPLLAQNEIAVLNSGSYAEITNDGLSQTNKMAINVPAAAMVGQLMVVTNNDGQDLTTGGGGTKFSVPAGKTILYVFDGTGWNDVTAIGMLKNPMEANNDDSQNIGANFKFHRSRGTASVQTKASVTASNGAMPKYGDTIATLSFKAHDGNSYDTSSLIKARMDPGLQNAAATATGNADVPGEIAIATAPDGSNVPRDRVVFDSTGSTKLLHFSTTAAESHIMRFQRNRANAVTNGADSVPLGVGAKATVSNGDQLGVISFEGMEGANSADGCVEVTRREHKRECRGGM